MPISMRILLVVASILMLVYVGHKIRTSQVRLADSMFWFMLSVMFIVISIFPEIIFWMCTILNIQSPTNLVYLMVIFLLIVKLFLTSIKLSQTEERLNNLAQEVAIRDERFIRIKTVDDSLEQNRK